jgi:hypothetical protein
VQPDRNLGRPSGRPIGDIPVGLGVGTVLLLLVRHPWRYICRRWNYKSALSSACVRGLLYFVTSSSAGFGAAWSALSTEFWFRLLTAGFYGAITQAFRGVDPPRAGMLAAMGLLPLVAHSLEITVHLLKHTANLEAGIAASLCFTALSTSFNLFAMRHGVLIMGEGSRSLVDDARRMPGLVVDYVAAIAAVVRGSGR